MNSRTRKHALILLATTSTPKSMESMEVFIFKGVATIFLTIATIALLFLILNQSLQGKAPIYFLLAAAVPGYIGIGVMLFLYREVSNRAQGVKTILE